MALFGYDWARGFVSPFQCTPNVVAEEVGTLIEEGSLVFDLGCGDGELLKGILRAKPSCKVFGIELDEQLARKAQQKHVEVWVGDLNSEQLLKMVQQKADVIVMFLLPSALRKLAVKLESFLSKSCPKKTVITIGWPIELWEASLVKRVFVQEANLSVYLYQ